MADHNFKGKDRGFSEPFESTTCLVGSSHNQLINNTERKSLLLVFSMNVGN